MWPLKGEAKSTLGDLSSMTVHGDELFLQLTREVRAEGCTLRPASLEDLFLKLTGRELRE